jgi:hypothetical protein
MSEYQYYEFRAVDRPLTRGEMAELRKISTRATITPRLLRNVYHWGDFKGEPLALVERYFDGFLYNSNWGSRQCMLRLPSGALDPEEARRYAVEGALAVHARAGVVILDVSLDDDGGGWSEDDEYEAPVRDAADARGDDEDDLDGDEWDPEGDER